MNKQQIAAVRRLERAFAAADRAGVAVCGMDDSLRAYPAPEFDRLKDELPSAYEVQQALINAEEDELIDTSGVYRESGGW